MPERTDEAIEPLKHWRVSIRVALEHEFYLEAPSRDDAEVLAWERIGDEGEHLPEYDDFTVDTKGQIVRPAWDENGGFDVRIHER